MSNYTKAIACGAIAARRPLTQRIDKPDIYWYDGWWRVSLQPRHNKKRDLWVTAHQFISGANQQSTPAERRDYFQRLSRSPLEAKLST